VERKAIVSEENLPPIMTIAEVARHTGLPELTVRRMAREGNIPALKLGRQWRIKRDLLEEWMEKHSLQGSGGSDPIK
jgi:excisionase family DNA binding protein